MEIIKKKKKELQRVMAILLLFSAVALFQNEKLEITSNSIDINKNGKTLVILDAGHGGNDPGKIGVDGTLEKDLNLEITFLVKDFLEQQDIEVLLTRTSDSGLYGKDTTNKKVEDMKNRCEIINKNKPSCVVSIHQNSYHEEEIKGAQVFYYSTSGEGEKLAEKIQENLVRYVEPTNHRLAKENNTYYLLKETKSPIVIVECGFLSNWEESAKLKEKVYQEKLAYAIGMGILQYLN